LHAAGEIELPVALQTDRATQAVAALGTFVVPRPARKDARTRVRGGPVRAELGGAVDDAPQRAVVEAIDDVRRERDRTRRRSRLQRELVAGDVAARSLVVRTSALERALFAVVGVVSDQVFRALEDLAVRVVHDQRNIGGAALEVAGRRAMDQTLLRDRKAEPARAAQLLRASVGDRLEPDVDRDGAPGG